MKEIQTFIQHLEAEKEACLQRANVLQQDNRADEASFAKIRANIFGIAVSVCRASSGQSPENPVAFIQSKLAHISREWVNSLSVSEQHGDHEKAAIERVKLEAMAEIDAPLQAIMEGRQ